MSRLIIIFIFTLNAQWMNAQQVRLMKFDELYSMVNAIDDTVYVLNFWATWCKPCIHELPYFEQVHSEFGKSPVKVLLVNLDFNAHVEKSVKPFVRNKKLQSAILHITDTDPNEWINKVDEGWSGAIPATVIIRNREKLFFREGAIDYVTLKENIDSILNTR